MTRERACLVRISGPANRWLTTDIRTALRRANKASPGDRTDVVRFEALSTQLERRALYALTAADTDVVELQHEDRAGLGFYDQSNADELDEVAELARAWIDAGDIAVEVRQTLSPGRSESHHNSGTVTVPPPAPIFRAIDDDGTSVEGKRAILLRFREQMRAALDGALDRSAALVPDGLSNDVLTKGLRRYVFQPGERIDVAVRYRDGSEARPFPVRALSPAMTPSQTRTEYHFALLSIRHTEMDAKVHGAWLRNVDISRPRPLAETDEVAYETTRGQLSRLLKDGPILLHLYQTGLAPAIIGFYRALTEHLAAYPGSVDVRPQFFRRTLPDQGTTPTVAGYQQQGQFSTGKLWAN